MIIEIYERMAGTGLEFKKIGTTRRAFDISYSDAWNDRADFEFSMSARADYAKSIGKESVVCIDRNFWGVVTSINKDQDEKHIYTFTGVSIAWWLLSSRVTIPTDYTSTDGLAGYDVYNGWTDAVIKHFWNNNMINPTQSGRKIPGVITTGTMQIGVSDDKYMTRFENLADVTKTLCENVKIGFFADVNVIENSITFDCKSGTNRTASQNQNARAILSIDRRNIASMHYELDVTDYKNAYYVTRSGAEFADEALTMLYYRDDTIKKGFERREVWNEISVQEPTQGDEYTELKKQSQKKMDESKEQEAFTCALAPNSGYRAVWNVGDTVTVAWKEEGITADMQVISVTVSGDENGINYTAKFGESKPKFVPIGNQILKI